MFSRLARRRYVVTLDCRDQQPVVLWGWCVALTNPESGPGPILFIQRVSLITKRSKPVCLMCEAPTGCMRFRIGFGTSFAQLRSLCDGRICQPLFGADHPPCHPRATIEPKTLPTLDRNDVGGLDASGWTAESSQGVQHMPTCIRRSSRLCY